MGAFKAVTLPPVYSTTFLAASMSEAVPLITIAPVPGRSWKIEGLKLLLLSASGTPGTAVAISIGPLADTLYIFSFQSGGGTELILFEEPGYVISSSLPTANALNFIYSGVDPGDSMTVLVWGYALDGDAPLG